MRVNIGLAQMYPKLGDVQANLDSHLQFIEQAKAKDVDLLIFPELSMTGYQIQDLVPEVALTTHSTHPILDN
ncbi:MAG: nitrilase-related carbon-nitrogen hydrolase [Anaerolineae bacterium]|nr:nitrilase-related carbon-nitrogen hydrolase [Anaerolineae bacterium]